MQLSIFLKEGIDPKKFMDFLFDCIKQGKDRDNSKILKWDIIEFTNIFKKPEKGYRHCDTQYDENGCITLKAYKDHIVGELRIFEGQEIEEEQEAIILFRFASMLKRHFSQYVVSISLLEI